MSTERRKSGEVRRPVLAQGALARHKPSRLVAGARRMSDGEQTLSSARKSAIGKISEPQREAMRLYETVGEIRHAIDTRARLVSAAHLIIGLPGDSENEDGRPVRDADGNIVEGLNPRLVERAETILAEITDDLGSQSGLIHAQARLYDAIGEAWLVSYWTTVDGTPTTEKDPYRFKIAYTFVSPDRINISSSVIEVAFGSDAESKIKLPSDAIVWRMWRPALGAPWDAWGWLLSSLPIGKTIDILTLEQRSQALRSSLGDIHIVPVQAAPQTDKPLPGDETAGNAGDLRTMTGEEFAESIDETLGDMIETVVENSDSSSTLVGAVIAIDKEFVGDFGNKISLARDPSPFVNDTLEANLRRLRESADTAPEMLAGLGDTNRWNGVQVSEEDYKRYHRPLLTDIANAWTIELLWFSLVAYGFPAEEVRQIRIVVDPSPIIADPDPSEAADEGVAIGAIGLGGWRKLKGVPDEYAPTPEELEEIRETQRSRRGGTPGGSSSGVNPVNTDAGSIRRIVASTPADLPDVNAIAEIEERLALSLVSAASMAVEAALQRATNVLTTRGKRLNLLTCADGLTPTLARRIADETFDTDEDRRAELFLAALQLLRQRHDAQVEIAIIAGLSVLGVVIPDESEDENTAVMSPWSGASVTRSEVNKAVESSWLSLLASLMLWAEARLFGAVTEAEMAAAISIPLPLIRRAIAAAGGTALAPGWDGIRPRSADAAAIIEAGDGSLFYGSRFGPLAPPIESWQWHYGTIATRLDPFPPHLALDGKTVNGIYDEALTSPEWGGYWIGDHKGCQCQLIPYFQE